MERPVLGRGLDELLGNTEEEAPSFESPSLENQVLHISIEKIKPDPNQPRRFFDEKSLEELANSMREQGLLQPIVASQENFGEYLIIAGERRWRAAQKIGWEKIPVIIKKTEGKTAQRKTLALVENLQRQDLNPMEEAQAFHWLMTHQNWTQNLLAEKIGKDRSSIANTLRLLNLHPEAQNLLAKNKISFSIAKLLLQEPSKEKQKIWGRMAAQNKLTVRELENKLKEANTPRQIQKKEIPLWLKLGCDRLSKKWSLNVSLRSGAKTSLVISFKDPEEIKEFIHHV